MSSRPLLWLTVFFMLGIACRRLFEETVSLLPPEYFAVASFVLLAAYSVLRPASSIPCPPSSVFRPLSSVFRNPSSVLRPLSSVFLFLVLGMWAASAAAPELPLPERLGPFFDRPMTSYIAEVSAPPDHFPDKVRVPLRIIAALAGGRQIPLDVGALLTVAGKSDAARPSFRAPGDRLIIRMTLKPYRNFKNPGSFDYARYQAEKGFYASAFLKDETFIAEAAPETGFSPAFLAKRAWGRIDLFRQRSLFWLRDSMDPDSAAFYAALLLGYQNFFDRTWQEHIQRTGLNHLLTVSGLHLGLVSLIVFMLVRWLVRIICPSVLTRISDSRIAIWPALACAVVYAFLAGFGVPPIWRSVLMLAVCFGASFWYRSTDSLTVLALSALIILFFDPNSLWQISFQLTFACVAAIVLIYPRLRRFGISRFVPWAIARKIVALCEEAFLVSIAVSILVLPLTIFYFNGFSLAGFAANVLLIPYVGFVILPCGLVSLAVFAISEVIAYPFAKAAELLLAVCLHLIRWFSGFSWSYFWTGSVSIFHLFAVYAVIGILLAPLSRRARIAALAALIVFFGGNAAVDLAPPVSGPTLRADIIDVGQGTSTLVRFPTGEAMLVDGGGFRDDWYDIGRAVVAPFLWSQGVGRLDHVVLSHDHPDHRNGLRFVLSNFDTGCFWTSGISDGKYKTGKRDGNGSGLEEIASLRGIKVRSFPDLLDEVRIGDVRINVRHPSPEFIELRTGASLNDVSLVIEVVFGQTALVLPGDIGAGIEVAVAGGFEKDRRVLLVAPHHGSEHSNSAELLDELRPIGVVFSCGYANQFGFPAPGALRRYEERKIKTYRTDLDGAVHAVSDGRQWTITTEEGR